MPWPGCGRAFRLGYRCKGHRSAGAVAADATTGDIGAPHRLRLGRAPPLRLGDGVLDVAGVCGRAGGGVARAPLPVSRGRSQPLSRGLHRLPGGVRPARRTAGGRGTGELVAATTGQTSERGTVAGAAAVWRPRLGTRALGHGGRAGGRGSEAADQQAYEQAVRMSHPTRHGHWRWFTRVQVIPLGKSRLAAPALICAPLSTDMRVFAGRRHEFEGEDDGRSPQPLVETPGRPGDAMPTRPLIGRVTNSAFSLSGGGIRAFGYVRTDAMRPGNTQQVLVRNVTCRRYRPARIVTHYEPG
eukprot:ctg_210.g157